MVHQLVIGGILITISIAIQAVVIGAVETVSMRLKAWLECPPRVLKLILALIVVVIMVMLGVSITTWMWACLFLWLEISPSLEEAIYFATVNVTTLGYGDITPVLRWRILVALSAANGMIVFGMSTAFLMEFLYELRALQRDFVNRKAQERQQRKLVKKQVRKQLKKMSEQNPR